MTNNIDEKKLKNDIEDYVEKKGWPGFFGLLATISPHKMDLDDLKKYQENLEHYNNVISGPEEVQHDENVYITPVKEASIYAEEHIPAVQDDLREQQKIQGTIENNVVEQPKTKVLEPRNVAPNPWGDAVTVSPGQLNL